MLLLTGAKDFTIKFWEMPDLSLLFSIKEDYPPHSL